MSASVLSRSAGLAAIVVMALLVVSMLVPVGAVSSSPGQSSTPAATAATSTALSTNPAPVAQSASSDGPHPGQIDTYEVAPGGGTTEDPSVAYDTVSYEPLLNVYQTLIAYNGSSTATFVPELSMCVPGTNGCTALYGSSLIVNNGQGEPEFYTYPIDPNAHFYDPNTGVSWPVFPSDVMFSIARTESFSEADGIGVTNGWIQTQALTQSGNSMWDGGLHSPFNNTPQGVLSAMLINDSTYCPALALAQSGCITFDAFGGGVDWPFFNELVADPLGASVEPCGWFTAQGAGLPGFEGTPLPNGDGPCLLPGGAHSTSDASFQNFLATTSPTAWDAVQRLSVNYPAIQPSVQWNMVGSGPYYMVRVDKSVGYVLQANPAYQAPTGCAGSPGCQPAAGSYQPTVNVYWEETDQVGIQELEAGQADFAGLSSTHTATLIQLQQAGKLDYIQQDTLAINFLPFNLNFSVSAAQGLDSVGTVSIPSDFFDAVGLRNFLTNAYPYSTIQSTVNTVDGIEFGFNYGGAIPQFMGNYYPTNISWPTGDPVTNPSVVGSAGWWWAEATNPTSPYYDPQLTSCTTSSPCTFPIVGQLGSPNLDEIIGDFISEITSISGGRIVPHTYDVSFSDLLSYGFEAPGTGPLPFWNLAWAPDYPDPTDYVTPIYLPNQTYAYGDALAQQFALPEFNAAGCPHQNETWVDLVYWANAGQIPNDCQGVAYSTMVAWYYNAAPLAPGNQRTLDYNLAEHIANELALYVYTYQNAGLTTYAPWINPATINTNVMIGAGSPPQGYDQQWYTIGYASAVSSVKIAETGLSAGTSWTATVGWLTETGTGTSLSFSLPAGNYTYYIWATGGYGVSPATGGVAVASGSSSSVDVVFTAFSGVLVPVTFSQMGIVSGSANWTIVLNGVGAWIGPSTAATFAVPAGTYTYAANGVPGYNLTAPTGSVTAGAGGASVTIPYVPTFAPTYAVVLSASGLAAGTSWTATVAGFSQSSTALSITFYETNGTYAWSVSAVNYGTDTPSGLTTVSGQPISSTVTFVLVTYTVTFTETGLPLGASWSVVVAGSTWNSTGTTVTGAEANGTYGYTIPASGIYNANPNSGSFAVDGAPVSNAVTFATGFALTFTETGAAAGASWTVTLNGVASTSTSASIVFTEPNGAYTYLVTPPSGTTASPSGGVITLSGAPVTTSITITSTTGTLAVTLQPGGPGSATVWIDGVNEGSIAVGQTMTWSESAGTHSVEVAAGGYYNYYNNATVAGGSTTSMPVVLNSSSSSSNSGSISNLGWALIGLFVALTVIFLITTVVYMRRAKPPASPPPSWSSGSSGTPGSNMPPPSK